MNQSMLDLRDLAVMFTDEHLVQDVIDMLDGGVGNDAVLQYLNMPSSRMPDIHSMYNLFQSGMSISDIVNKYDELAATLDETLYDPDEDLDELYGDLSWEDLDEDLWSSEYD